MPYLFPPQRLRCHTYSLLKGYVAILIPSSKATMPYLFPPQRLCRVLIACCHTYSLLKGYVAILIPSSKATLPYLFPLQRLCCHTYPLLKGYVTCADRLLRYLLPLRAVFQSGCPSLTPGSDRSEVELDWPNQPEMTSIRCRLSPRKSQSRLKKESKRKDTHHHS